MRYMFVLIMVVVPTFMVAQRCKFDSLVQESRVVIFGENHNYPRTTTQLLKNAITSESEYDTIYVILEIPYSIADAINQSIHSQDLARLKNITRLDPILKKELAFFIWVTEHNSINEQKVFIQGCETELFPEMLLYYLNYASLSALRLPDAKIVQQIDSLKNEDLRYKSATWISSYLLRTKLDFQLNSIAYQNYFGVKLYERLAHALTSFNPSYTYLKIYKDPLNEQVFLFRDSIMSNHMHYIYKSNLGPGVKFLIVVGKAHASKKFSNINYKGWVPAAERFSDAIKTDTAKILTVDICYAKKKEKRHPEVPAFKDLSVELIEKDNNTTVCRIRI